MVDAVGKGLSHWKAAAREHLHHLRVPGHHIGLELLDPHRARDLREVLEEEGADATALMLVGDDERHLGARGSALRGLRAVVAPDGDEPLFAALAQDGGQRDVLREIEIGQVPKLVVGQAALVHERAIPHGLRAQALKEARHQRLVRRPDGTDEERTAIPEHSRLGVVAKVCEVHVR